MKNFIVIVILCLSTNQALGLQDTLGMGLLVKNVFNAKVKYEGAAILADSASRQWMSASIIETLFTQQGITVNVDSIGKVYDLNVQQIKSNKIAFYRYYNSLFDMADTPVDPSPYFQSYTMYYFMHPYSSTIGEGALMSHHQCVRLIKHFLIDLDYNRLPTLAEANKYLESKGSVKNILHRSR